jgi:S1-C subfamily serine protease
MKRSLIFICLSIFCVGMLRAQTTTPTVSDVLETVLTSVVTVSVEQTAETKQILGFRGESDVAYEKILDLSDSKGSGSGFVIDKNGKKYVITNAHVIEDAAETVGSIFVYSINRTKYEAKVVGGDSFYDIAVLEFVKTPGPEIKPIVFSTKEPRIGEQVYAVGNPLGEYPYTVSEGIISAKNRVRGGLTGKFGFLQSTATVIWGNSGGPLVNAKGQVVGINSQIAFAEMGGESIWQPQINFALEGILSNRLVNDINNGGRVKRAYIGVEVTQEYAYNEYSTKSKNGWELADSLPVIRGIVPGSPAEAVLKDKIGYQIVKIGLVDVRNTEEVLGEFEVVKPGEKVKFTLQKNGVVSIVEVLTTDLTPTQSEAIATYVFEKNTPYKLTVLEGIPYITFSQDEPYVMGAGDRMKGIDSKGEKSRGNEIPTGTWEIAAAGYEESSYSAIWRVKSLADLGVALRLTASLGAVDVYIVRKGGRVEDMESKRISFSGDEDYQWLNNVWY